MKKTFLRAVCAILFLLTLVSCVSGGGDVKETAAPGTGGEVTEERITADLPDLTFDGRTLNMLHWFVPGWAIHGTDLYVEEETGEPINDEVFIRNQRLQEKYDMEFSLDELDYNDMITKIRAAVTTSDDPYDLVGLRIADAPRVMVEGNLLDYSAIPYVNLEKPYWDQSVQEMFSFAGHLFLMTSDTTINDKNATAALAFNKVLVRDLEMPDLYELVRSGSWTMDEMLDLMDGYNADLNGDGEVNPDDDISAFLGADDVVMAFFMGGEGHFTVRDEYDYPILDFDTEENYDILDKVFDFMYHDRFVNFYEQRATIAHGQGYYLLGGHGVFQWLRIEDVIKMRGQDGDDFGLVPTPKYDEAQENYLSLLSKHGSTAQCMLWSESDPEFVGFMMEAMAAASHYDLQEAYYDVTLMAKSTRDDDSKEMLDIMFAHRVIDIAEICEFGGFPDYLLRFASNHHGRNFASAYATYEEKMQKDIDDFIEKLDEMGV